jgi:hypothetical protein
MIEVSKRSIPQRQNRIAAIPFPTIIRGSSHPCFGPTETGDIIPIICRMNRNHEIFKGVIRGNVIELDESPNLPSGQQVTVVVHPSNGGAALPPGEGLRRSAGAWADDAEALDQYLHWTRQQRKQSRPNVEP